MKKPVLLLGLLLIGCSTSPDTGNPLLKRPQVNASPCLSQEVIDQRLAVLEDIPKPIDRNDTNENTCDENTQCNIDPDGTENPGGVNCLNASGRGCTDHPDSADYILVGSQVKVTEIVLGNRYPSDRQLIKQIFPADHPLHDKIYRPFCGDWCWPGSHVEGFRGTFYCDFVFYLTSEYDPDDPAKHYPADPDLPANGSVFDVYMRDGAPIPEKAKCRGETDQQSSTLKDFINQFFDVRAQDENQPIIQYANDRWIYVGHDGTVKTKDVSSQRVNLSDGYGLAQFEGVEYEVYQDLPARFGPDIIYLTQPGKVEEAYENYQNDPNDPNAANRRLSFKEFHRSLETKPGHQGLQLGTFLVPIAATWIKDWVFESKPAIYLYPQEPTHLSVKLSPMGQLTTSLPAYPPAGWQVLAYPGGQLVINSSRYRYLYYEAAFDRSQVRSLINYDQGYLVTGNQLESQLAPLLEKLGLNDPETTDFINYWQSRLTPNQVYFTHFLNPDTIESLEPLTLTILPDALIRVRAYFQPTPPRISPQPQPLPELPARQGFTVVEWGGFLDK